MCDCKASCITFSTVSDRDLLDASVNIQNTQSSGRDKNFFLSFMKMSGKMLRRCVGAPCVRAQVLPLIVLIYETLISRSPYCQYWLLQLQTLHLHSSMQGKRRERSLSRDVWKCLEATSRSVHTALQTMPHGLQFSLMT